MVQNLGFLLMMFWFVVVFLGGTFNCLYSSIEDFVNLVNRLTDIAKH